MEMMPFSCWSSENVVTLRNICFDLVLDSTVKALDQDPCMLPWFSGLSCPRPLLRRCSEISTYPELNKRVLDDGFCGEKKPNRKTWDLTQRQECINALLSYPANLNLHQSDLLRWLRVSRPPSKPRDQLAPLLWFKAQKNPNKSLEEGHLKKVTKSAHTRRCKRACLSGGTNTGQL